MCLPNLYSSLKTMPKAITDAFLYWEISYVDAACDAVTQGECNCFEVLFIKWFAFTHLFAADGSCWWDSLSASVEIPLNFLSLVAKKSRWKILIPRLMTDIKITNTNGPNTHCCSAIHNAHSFFDSFLRIKTDCCL